MQQVVASQYFEGTSTTFTETTQSESITVNKINSQTANPSTNYLMTYGESVTITFTVNGTFPGDTISVLNATQGGTFASMTLPSYSTSSYTGTISFTMPWSLTPAEETSFAVKDMTTGVYSSTYTIYLAYPTKIVNVSYPSGQWYSGESINVTGTLQYESASGTWSGLSNQTVTLSYTGTSSGTAATATTDSNGNFSLLFYAPSPGSYTFTISYGGYVPSGLTAASLQASQMSVEEISTSSAGYAFNVVVVSPSSTTPTTTPTVPTVTTGPLWLLYLGLAGMAGGYGYAVYKRRS